MTDPREVNFIGREIKVPRKAGIPNRNYPPLTLSETLRMAQKMEDEASGMALSRLTLADLVGTTPSSSTFRDLVASSRFYGLTSGGINSESFSITRLGEQAISDDDAVRVPALKAAVTKIAPFKTFFDAFNGKKMPGATAAKEFLVRDASVADAHVDDCLKHIVSDAETAGFLRVIKQAKWIDLSGAPAPSTAVEEPDAEEEEAIDDALGNEPPDETPTPPGLGANGSGQGKGVDTRPKAIFIGGRKGKDLDGLKSILDEYKIPYKLAEGEANAGRPISQKVADVMRECGAAILVFTPDQELQDKDGNAIWRPTENLVHELGAASMLYGNRIIIFREESVNFASNFSDIGHITFTKGDLSGKAIELFRELISFGLITVSVPTG